jgi:hypothetical protein
MSRILVSKASLPCARGASAGAASVGHRRPAVCAVEDTNGETSRRETAYRRSSAALYQKAQAGGSIVR